MSEKISLDSSENKVFLCNKSVFLYVGKAIKKSRNIYEIFGKMMVFSI